MHLAKRFEFSVMSPQLVSLMLVSVLFGNYLGIGMIASGMFNHAADQ